MEFLYFLENLRNPVLDFLFSTVTHLGEETFFLVLAILFFWCINKREGYYILIVGLFGTIINQGLKLAFRIDRPWVKDPSFTVVGGALEEATGYSFPSGHTQNAAGTFGSIAAYSKKNWVRIGSLALIALIALSRMYLGVHTPLDVICSLLIAILLVMILQPVFTSEKLFLRVMPYIVGASFFAALALLLYVNLTDTAGVDAANLYSARKNAATLFGCMLGLVLVYPIDRLLIKFNTRAVWYAQVIKLALGLLGVMLIKSLLKSPLEALFVNEFVARAARYFLVVAFAGAIWPLTFKYFANMRLSFMDKFTASILKRLKIN